MPRHTLRLSLPENLLSFEPSRERQGLLQQIVDHVALRRTCGERSDLIFICTHNSRRSHLAHIWATVAAYYYDVDNVHCWSGGTEATAFDHRAVATLERSGFEVQRPAGVNPKFELTFAEHTAPIICFSKIWNDSSNPDREIAAIMVCDHAEQNCPFIPGAIMRVGLPFIDPKASDGTDQEQEIYDLRSSQIAAEMFWIFKQLSNG